MKLQLGLGLGLALSAGVLLGACATKSFPNKRPLTTAQMDQMGQTDVIVDDNLRGVSASWFMSDSSAAGAQYGLLGALVSATMDAIMNAAPAHRAQRSADEVAEVALTEKLNSSLLKQLEINRTYGATTPITLTSASAAAATPSATLVSAPATGAEVTGAAVVTAPAPATAPAPKVTLGTVRSVQKVDPTGPYNDTVEIMTSYVLSEDASAIRVVATATYENNSVKYSTPYALKKIPKSELSGPLYRNTFTYESDRFPLPALTPELKERMIVAIRDSYKDASGNAPADGTDDFKKMNEDITAANDDKLTKSEAAIFLVRAWTKDNGAALYKEVEKSHAFIAKYVLADLNNPSVPSPTGADQLVETMADGRTVRIIGAGVGAGQYTSSAVNTSDFTTYGNASSIAKVNRDKIKALRDQAKLTTAAK